MRPTRLPRLALAAALVGGALPAHALCTLSATSLVFGGLSLLGGGATDRTSSANISLTCLALPSAVSYSIAIGPSAQPASVMPRYMSNPLGGAPMEYNLFLDAGHAVPWGDGVTGGVAAASIGPVGLLPVTQVHTVHGKVAAAQPPLRPGAFLDFLTVTVTYNP